MGNPHQELQGELVTLCAIDMERDASEWFEAMQEAELHTWTSNRVPSDIDEVKNVVLATFATHPEIIAWCIRELKTNQMVGIYWMGVPFKSDENKWITFDAQRIAKPYWRKGYTKEARSLVYHNAFMGIGVIPKRKKCGLSRLVK